MVSSTYWLMLVAAILLPSGSNALGDQREELKKLKKTVDYHLKGLKRSLDSINAIQRHIYQTEDIESRSLDDDGTLWDGFITPILHFCQSLNGVNEGIKNTLPESELNSFTDKDGFVYTIPSFSTEEPFQERVDDIEWFLPEVRPIRVQAERIGSNVKLIFDVLHSGPATVARVGSFQFAVANLSKSSEISGTSLSHVQFITDAFMCNSGKFDFEADYAFAPKMGEFADLPSSTYIRIDTCGFDKYQNMSLEFEDRVWLTRRQGIFEENIEYPKFRIVSNTKSSTILWPGQKEIIELEVHLTDSNRFIISSVLYNYDTGKELKYYKVIDVWGREKGKPRIMGEENGEKRTFTLEVIHESNFINKTVDDEFSRDINLTLRITMLTGSGRFGGYLMFHTWQNNGDYYDRRVVTSVSTIKVLSFKQLGLLYPPPEQKPVINIDETYICTEEGNRVFPREGVNCTVKCNAFGRGIRSISVTKADSLLTPYRSVSYVIDDGAFSMIDVGPASSRNEGIYRCTVESLNGRVEKTSHLYTTGFPELIEETTTLVQFDNGTTEVTCNATGTVPLNMSVEIGFEKRPREIIRIDNKTNYIRNLQEREDGLLLTLRLPTEDLKYPTYTLECRVQSVRGADMKTFYLYNDIRGYYESVTPRMDKQSARIVSFGNGTTTITCGASGASPLDIWMMFGGRGKVYRIDNLPSSSKVETNTVDGKSATLFVDTQSLRGSSSWFFCEARNKYGRDYYDFNLRNYIDY